MEGGKNIMITKVLPVLLFSCYCEHTTWSRSEVGFVFGLRTETLWLTPRLRKKYLSTLLLVIFACIANAYRYIRSSRLTPKSLLSNICSPPPSPEHYPLHKSITSPFSVPDRFFCCLSILPSINKYIPLIFWNRVSKA